MEVILFLFVFLLSMFWPSCLLKKKKEEEPALNNPQVNKPWGPKGKETLRLGRAVAATYPSGPEKSASPSAFQWQHLFASAGACTPNRSNACCFPQNVTIMYVKSGIFISSGSCNKTPQTRQFKGWTFISHDFGGWKVQDQGEGRAGSWWGLSSQLAEGCLRAVCAHGRESSASSCSRKPYGIWAPPLGVHITLSL